MLEVQIIPFWHNFDDFKKMLLAFKDILTSKVEVKHEMFYHNKNTFTH